MRLLTFVGGGRSTESPGIYTEEHQMVPILQSTATVTISLLVNSGTDHAFREEEATMAALFRSSAPVDAWKTVDPEALIVAKPPKVYGS